MADLDGSTAVSGGDQMTRMSRTEDAGRQPASAIIGKSGPDAGGKVAGTSSMASALWPRTSPTP